MIKNAIIFKAELPVGYALEIHMEERPWREITASEERVNAFWSDEGKKLVQKFPGGYAFCMRTDEKVLPSSVVKVEADKEINKIKRDGEKVTGQDKAAIRLSSKERLLKRALVKQRYTWAYYLEDDNLLIVDSASKGVADTLVSLLIFVCGSVKTQTIHISDIKKGFTTRLRDENHEDHPFGRLGLGEYIQLSRKEEGVPTEKITFAHTDLAECDILGPLFSGYEVDVIEFIYGTTEFRMTSDFHFKRFSFPKMEIAEDEDALHRFQVEAAEETSQIREIALELCRLMEYTPPTIEEMEAASGGTDSSTTGEP